MDLRELFDSDGIVSLDESVYSKKTIMHFIIDDLLNKGEIVITYMKPDIVAFYLDKNLLLELTFHGKGYTLEERKTNRHIVRKFIGNDNTSKSVIRQLKFDLLMWKRGEVKVSIVDGRNNYSTRRSRR